MWLEESDGQVARGLLEGRILVKLAHRSQEGPEELKIDSMVLIHEDHLPRDGGWGLPPRFSLALLS